MFLTLLKRAVKAVVHDAVEEWALESGLPRTVADEMRAQRLALTTEPEATAAAIDAEGWLHTGDVGAIDAEGRLRILDRLKDVVIVGGGALPAVRVELNPLALNKYGLGLEDVRAVLAGARS